MKHRDAYATLAFRALAKVYGKPGATTKVTLSPNASVSTPAAGVAGALVAGTAYRVFADNASGGLVWIKVGSGTVTAAVTDMPILCQSEIYIIAGDEASGTVPVIATWAAAGDSGSIYFTAMGEVDDP